MFEIISAEIQKYDRIVSEYENKWGNGNLELFCDAETASKFYRHREKLNDAVEQNNVFDVRVLVDGLERAYQKMDAEAVKNGHKTSPDVMFYKSDSHEYVICRTHVEANMAIKRYPDKKAVCVSELINILEAVENKVFEKSSHVPQIQTMGERFDFNKGDGIPFD